MRKKLNEIFKSEFLKNFGFVFSGNGLALVIPFLIAPFLTRLYTPEDFAGYELFARVVALLIAIATLRFDVAIILPKHREESIEIVRLAFRVLVISTLLMTVLIFPFRDSIANFVGNTSLAGYLWWVPVSVFFGSALYVLSQFLVREKAFKAVAVNKLVTTGSGNLAKYGMGFFFRSGLGLVLGHLIGVVVPVFMLFKRIEIRSMLRELIHTKSESLKATAIRYKQFPMYNMPHAFYDEGIRTLLFVAISAYYGELIVGLFGLTYRYIRVPVQVFGGALTQVFVPEIAGDYEDGADIRPKVKKVILSLFAIGFLPFAILFFIGPDLFGLVFGDQWIESGKYAVYIAPWLFFNFIVSPVSMVPSIARKQGKFFLVNVLFTLIASAFLVILPTMGYGFDVVLITYSAINALLNIFLAFWFVHILNPLKRVSGL